jgi:hypothetical protein
MFWRNLLVFLHLVGLAMGLGVGIANLFIARWAASTPAPESAMALRALPPRLSQVSQIGLGILVVTGLLLLFTVSGMASYAFGQFWFYLKLVAVAGMGAVIYFLYQAQVAIKAGREPQFKEYLPQAGMILGGLGLAATLFAVLAFDFAGASAAAANAALEEMMRNLPNP